MIDTLHIAAMPFPTPQGTQAAIHQMLQARWLGGKRDALYCYALANPAVSKRWQPMYPIIRVYSCIDKFAGSRSERSGPSWYKAVNDMIWSAKLLIQIKQLAPKHILAHHVEAGCVMVAYSALRRLCSLKPCAWSYGMHTALALELPTYFKTNTAKRFARSVGFMLDRWLVTHAPEILALSPWLRKYVNKIAPKKKPRRIGRLHVSFRWPALCGTLSPRPRSTEVGAHLLYIGNLDKYQNIEAMVNTVALAQSSGLPVTLRIVTASDPQEVARWGQRVGLRMEILQKDNLDLGETLEGISAIIVPRTLPGGIPMKVLDALRTDRPILISETLMGSFEKDLGWKKWTDRLGCVAFDRTAAGLFGGILEILRHPGPISEPQRQARQLYLSTYYG